MRNKLSENNFPMGMELLLIKLKIQDAALPVISASRGLDYPHNIAKLSEIILLLSRNYPKIIRSFFWFSNFYLVTFYRFASISIQIGTFETQRH
jgi:hypothetical protein